jgi:ribokinase
MNYQCTVIGDIALDRFLLAPDIPIFPSPSNPGNFILNLEIGHKIPVSQVYDSIGGNAYNITYGLSLLGISTALVASIGEDSLSNYITDSIKNLNLNTEHIFKTVNSGVNQSTILSINGERIVFSHHQPKDYTNLSLPTSEWLYITSLSKGSEPILENIVANSNDYKLVFNPGSYLMKHNLDLIHQIIPKTKILFVNKEEAQHIINSADENIVNLIQSLHNMGAKIVAITDGNNGAYVSNNENRLYLPARQVDKKETTGAGDAFAAGFLAAFIQRNEDISQALKWGIIQSSSVLREVGSVNGLSSLDEVVNIAETLSPQNI